MLDVLVIGGGNAALCAALTAREAGASVMLLERAPKPWRGGNSPHTRNIRCMHDAPQDVLVDSLFRRGVLAGPAQGHRRAGPTRRWRASRSAHRRPAATGCVATASTSSRRSRARCTSREPTRSSWAAARHWSTPTTAAPRRLAFASATTPRSMPSSSPTAASSRPGSARTRSRRAPACSPPAASSPTASGCDEAWGHERARRVAGRELPHSRHPLQHRRPAQVHARRRRRPHQRSDPGAHASRSTPARRSTTAASARASIASRSASWSTARAKRFYDEGEDFWPKRYAIWGRLVAAQPGQIAYSIIDRKAIGRFMPPVFPGTRAASLPELARALGLPEEAFLATLARLQRRVPRRQLRPHRPGRLPHRRPRARQDALGAADRHAALLRLCAQAGHDLHLPRPEGERARRVPTSAARRATTCSWPAR